MKETKGETSDASHVECFMKIIFPQVQNEDLPDYVVLLVHTSSASPRTPKTEFVWKNGVQYKFLVPVPFNEQPVWWQWPYQTPYQAFSGPWRQTKHLSWRFEPLIQYGRAGKHRTDLGGHIRRGKPRERDHSSFAASSRRAAAVSLSSPP